VNPENDTLEALIGYLSQYANQFFEGSAVKLRLEMPIGLPPLSLPAELRHDLFLVVKEALNNVMKHGHASEVRVKVSCSNALAHVVIADDGCGFDPAVTSNGRKGHGLENMRKRMASPGREFSLTSAPGQGTTVSCNVQLGQVTVR